MPIIEIEVTNKIAQAPVQSIVCGNKDYQVKFLFDDEWAAYKTKTARFAFNGQVVDVLFDDDVCNVPVISNARTCAVGVYAGDLHTTTPALVSCVKSILCKGGAPADPTPDLYAQLLEKLNDIDEITEDEIARAVEDYIAARPEFVPLQCEIVYTWPSGYSCSRTFEEMWNALASGRNVVFTAPTTVGEPDVSNIKAMARKSNLGDKVVVAFANGRVYVEYEISADNTVERFAYYVVQLLEQRGTNKYNPMTQAAVTAELEALEAKIAALETRLANE